MFWLACEIYMGLNTSTLLTQVTTALQESLLRSTLVCRLIFTVPASGRKPASVKPVQGHVT
jgi:hypothetical protein